ncbi:Ltp family lipoprotein [Candidatus Saccharibacteria bacterium]|nr:Ltp family lipoprotein [Candidatus Saccharibacteria bacterium]
MGKKNTKARTSATVRNQPKMKTEAKPVYKQWWFWVVIGAVLIGIGASRSNKNEDSEPVKGAVVESSQTVEKEDEAEVEEEVEEKDVEEATLSQKNALQSAKSYLSFSAFSYDGLVSQLEFEKYSHEDAVYAADNCGADWNEQAVKSAKSYLRMSAFSHDGLVDQLEFEGFTTEQAEYGVTQNGL